MTQESISLDIAYHFDSESDDSPRFHAAAEWICRHFKLTQFHCSIAIVDDPTIHQLNVEHLQHDWPTDVISFVFSDATQEPLGCIEGEIIASAEMAARLGIQANWSSEDELLLYVVHGMLHLAGLDDQTEEQRLAMRELEQKCLLDLGVAAENHVSRSDDISY